MSAIRFRDTQISNSSRCMRKRLPADPDCIKVTSRIHAPDGPLTSYRVITASEARPRDSDINRARSHYRQTRPSSKSRMSLAILKRALDAHPHNRTSILDAGEEIWRKDEQAKEWEPALNGLGGPVIDLCDREMIWTAWLSWAMRSVKNVDEYLSCVRRAFAVFNFQEAAVIRVRLLWELCVIFTRVVGNSFRHLLYFLTWTLGYSEQAMGVFQAQMEL